MYIVALLFELVVLLGVVVSVSVCVGVVLYSLHGLFSLEKRKRRLFVECVCKKD